MVDLDRSALGVETERAAHVPGLEVCRLQAVANSFGLQSFTEGVYVVGLKGQHNVPGPARRALIVHGCDAATSRTQIAQIARRTGVSVGTVYHHFPDKRDILLELIDQWSDSLPYQRRMALDIEPRAATRQILRRLFEQMKKGGSLHRLILTESMHDSVLRRHYERAQRAVVESMCDLIEMGRTRGLVRPERRPATTAFLLHHAIDMTLGLAEHSASDAEAERLLDEAADLICNYVFLEDQLE